MGADIPSYELIGTTLRIRFRALESALIDQPKVPKHQSTKDDGALEDAMVLKVIEVLKEQVELSVLVVSALDIGKLIEKVPIHDNFAIILKKIKGVKE